MFGVAFSDIAIEYLAEPVKVFRENARVRKSAGLLFFETPNK